MLWKSKYRRVKQLSTWYKSKGAGHRAHGARAKSMVAASVPVEVASEMEEIVIEIESKSKGAGHRAHGSCDESMVATSDPVEVASEMEEIAIKVESGSPQINLVSGVHEYSSSDTKTGTDDFIQSGAAASADSECIFVGKRVRLNSKSSLAIAFSGRKKAKMVSEEKLDATVCSSQNKPKLDPCIEIHRILEAQSAQDVLNVPLGSGEEVVTHAWKQLVFLLHPDKLQHLGEELRETGAEALLLVHNAKEEMKRQFQEVCVEVPAEPLPDGLPRCLSRTSGARKYEVRWTLPQCQDPQRPVEKYEIWGPKYFKEDGEPIDWVMLASLPPLQAHFVLVEEAPTQQDCMWAADRVRRPTLPLVVNAVNGRGVSTSLTFELPWHTEFPWLQGNPSVLCPRCCQLSQRRGAWSKCGGCGFSVPAENALVIRCLDCQGEVLWAHKGAELSCSCCFKKFGGPTATRSSAQDQWKKTSAPKYVPPNSGQGAWSGRAGASHGGRSGGSRYKHN